MKAILMSIHPRWVKEIFVTKRKTMEVRKSAPKIETPFKVYVYCTKHKLTHTKCMNSYLHKNEQKACKEYGTITTWCEIGDVLVNVDLASAYRSFGMHGKVIGSFVCRGIMRPNDSLRIMAGQSLLTENELLEYSHGKELFGWRITEPKLFDKPRELGEFSYPAEHNFTKRTIKESREMGFICHGVYITRTPQSWCYVEGRE